MATKPAVAWSWDCEAVLACAGSMKREEVTNIGAFECAFTFFSAFLHSRPCEAT